MRDSEVYRRYTESAGGKRVIEFDTFKKKANYVQWMRKERSRQGLDQVRTIDDRVENACAQMFLQVPAKGNTYETLWKMVFARAKRLGLKDSLRVDDLVPGDIRAIAGILDDVFTNGTMLRYIRRRSSGIRFVIVEESDRDEPDAAMYLDSTTNTMALVRPTWKRRMPGGTRMDGVRVSSKLEWLCRMVAHELCHSLANLACSQSCMKGAKNHGPVFRRLNHSIFGHPSDRDF